MAKEEIAKTSGGWKTNKWFRAAIPALLLHCSIGTVYCWSIFSQEIADYIGFSKAATEWAFSFAIFFLGMSAAFLGNIVEKDIHMSSLIATICFALGMAGTGFFIYYGGAHRGSVLALVGIYICYGFIMGIGLGTGYLSPVKTLMLWFEDRKGLATGLAVAGFGAAKAIASPIMQALLDNLGDGGIYKMFLILAVVYFIMMFVGHLLLKKPEGWHEPQKKEKGKGLLDVIKTQLRGHLADVLYQHHLRPGADLPGENDRQVHRSGRRGGYYFHRLRYLQRGRPSGLLRMGGYHEGSQYGIQDDLRAFHCLYGAGHPDPGH